MATTYESSFEITSWEETDLVEGDVRVYRTDVEKRFTGDIEPASSPASRGRRRSIATRTARTRSR
ncbi:MAG TPA: hypothetical protein VLA33_09830 [Gemmatimonadota bacterium]|nr:hypothetical protein [Gemmatimonadota bacterium]